MLQPMCLCLYWHTVFYTLHLAIDEPAVNLNGACRRKTGCIFSQCFTLQLTLAVSCQW